VYRNTVGANSLLELGVLPDDTGAIPADQMALLQARLRAAEENGSVITLVFCTLKCRDSETIFGAAILLRLLSPQQTALGRL
jgi:hypothetical protein